MKVSWWVVCISIMVLCVGQGYAAEQLQPMTIQLNWLPNVQFAGVLLAKEKGWYQEAGIDLTIKGWAEGITPINEVSSGKAQIGVSEGAEFIKAKAEGAAIKVIATQFQKSPFCLISKKEKGIETLAQLTGKKIGIPDSETLLMLKIVLANQKLPFDQITPVEIGWDFQPFIDDKIDVLPGYMNNELLSIKDLGYDVTYLPAFKYGYDFYSGVYVVSEMLLQQQPQLIQKFLEMTLRGWREAFQNPEATAKLIVEKYYPDGSVSQQTESLKVFQTLATLGEGKKFLGWMEEQFWTKGVDILANFQQIAKKIPAKDLFTMEFLENIYFK
jgi:NitT/TauT family transport system substrate-binding protein